MVLVPAVLPVSQKDLIDTLAFFDRIPARRVQIDVVDGRFAAPASWPYTAPLELQNRVRSGEPLPRLDRVEYEIDLMCEDAEIVAGEWLSLGASRLTLHLESVPDIRRLVNTMRRAYCAEAHFATSLVSFGLAINIDTDLAALEPCLDQVEYVQCMGIAHIGVQGAPLDSRIFDRLQTFRARHPDMPLQVDGGVSLENARELLLRGAGTLVVGSALRTAADVSATAAVFEALESPYGV